jgi:YidC/Oxa1 family membrane protein insertase
VDKKQLGWIAILLAGGLVLGMLWMQKRSGDEGAEAASQAAARAETAARAEAAAPLGGLRPAATPQPGAASATAASAPAVANRDEWLQDQSGLGERDIFTAGNLDPAKGFLFQVQFDRRGAAIHTVKLSQVFTTDADKRAWEAAKGDHAAYMAEVAASNGRLKGHYCLLNPVGQFQAYATQRIVVGVKGSPLPPATIPLDKMPWKHEATEQTTKPADDVEVCFSATLYRDVNHEKPSEKADYRPALKITKTYTVAKQDYSLKMRLKAENLSAEPLVAYIDQLGPAGVPQEELFRGSDDRFLVYGKQKAEGGQIEVAYRMHAELQGGKVPVNSRLGRSDDAAPVLWVGESNKFFASIIYLEPTAPGSLAAAGWQADFYFLSEPESPTSNVHIPAIRVGGRRTKEDVFAHVPDMALPAGGAGKEMTFDIFAGPKKRDMLTDASAPYFQPLYKQLDYIGSINFQSCFCAFNSLTLGMMWLLQAISKIAFGNYGVAIMILVVLVRVVLHPLTKKSQMSMMNMQKLAPEMEKIKKKYADDKEALQREQMKLYKHQGLGPMLGCLPMFLQMPIWLSLWGSLSVAVELRHAAFLPVWITDLAAPDVIFSWSNPIILPLIGGMTGPIYSFNLLPLLLTVAMFLQAKLNPQMTGAATAPTKEQETQQKMMRYMMPAMMLLFFYNAASGLTLYIMTSTFAGVIEQMVIRRHIEAKRAAEAAATTTVRVPGKAPRDNRPKKSKGPMFFKRG